MKKISIIGAGNVGAQVAFLATIKELGNIILVDVTEGIAKGKALDLQQATPLLQSSVKIQGTSDYQEIKDSDIVIVTAGVPRKPGMAREDLLATNAKIVKEVVSNVAKYAPQCILILVTNPLDEMVYLAKKISNFPKERILGMAGALDTARFQMFIAEELKCNPHDVLATVLGSHGDTMVPLPRFTTVNKKSITELMPENKLSGIIERTRNGGIEIVNYLKTGSAFFAPASAIIAMVESIIKDQKRTLPCCVELSGEYGYNHVLVGVPVVLGRKGVEKIIELPLNQEEKKLLAKTVEHVKSHYPDIDKLLR
ncbi:malate dehydrogenase [Candidatus Woesearchaeota archaeon]|nr:malate dehydrogenase [Candidatus Woesearchaeota archaeon]